MSSNGTNRRALDTVTDMYLSFNHVDTLLPLVVVPARTTGTTKAKDDQKESDYNAKVYSSSSTAEVRGFQHLEIIMADHNYIRWLCPGYRGQLNYHAWPYEMTSLIHLDLSYNRLDALPDLLCMPNLQHLNVHLIQQP